MGVSAGGSRLGILDSIWTEPSGMIMVSGGSGDGDRQGGSEVGDGRKYGRMVGSGQPRSRASFSMVSTKITQTFCMWLVGGAHQAVEAMDSSKGGAAALGKRFAAREKNG